MNVLGWLLVVGQGPWRLLPLTESPSSTEVSARRIDGGDLAQQAQAVGRVLQESGGAGAPIVLALESRHCLSARVSTPQSGRKRRQAWSFAFEEQVPVAAEDFVADFLPLGQGEALGVCVELAWLRPIVDALENQNLRMPLASPLAWLATAQAASDDPGLDAVVVRGQPQEARGVDVLELRDGRPLAWHWYPQDSLESLAPLQHGPSSPSATSKIGLVAPGDLAAAPGFGNPLGPEAAVLLGDVDSAAGRHALALISQGTTPWLNFRQGPLATRTPLQVYHRPTVALLVAVAIALLCVTAVTQWRTARYRSLQQQLVTQQAEVFAGLFPQQRLPSGIKARLTSEHRKLAGLGGQEADAGLIQEPSALAHLERVLEHLPSDVTFRVVGLQIDPDVIRVDGEALSHSDADRIVSSLRQSGHFEVEQPRTQTKSDESVGFLFTMRPRAGLASSAAVASGPPLEPAVAGGEP